MAPDFYPIDEVLVSNQTRIIGCPDSRFACFPQVFQRMRDNSFKRVSNTFQIHSRIYLPVEIISCSGRAWLKSQSHPVLEGCLILRYSAVWSLCEGKYHLHIQGKRSADGEPSMLADISETSVHIWTTRCYVPEDGNFHNYRCDNLHNPT
jgi:hypothetical protein